MEKFGRTDFGNILLGMMKILPDIIDYIHYNPVKHNLVDRPVNWEFSTFHKYLAEGWYSEEWGCKEPQNLKNMRCVGE